jgi:AraC-like DNA-binding protein
MSERNFARRFQAETGTTPLQWLLRQRVLAARELLETSTASIDDVAARCGFGTAVSLRAHFRRFVATTPTDYRRAFAAAQPGGLPTRLLWCQLCRLRLARVHPRDHPRSHRGSRRSLVVAGRRGRAPARVSRLNFGVSW